MHLVPHPLIKSGTVCVGRCPYSCFFNRRSNRLGNRFCWRRRNHLGNRNVGHCDRYIRFSLFALNRKCSMRNSTMIQELIKACHGFIRGFLGFQIKPLPCTVFGEDLQPFQFMGTVGGFNIDTSFIVRVADERNKLLRIAAVQFLDTCDIHIFPCFHFDVFAIKQHFQRICSCAGGFFRRRNFLRTGQSRGRQHGGMRGRSCSGRLHC